MVDTTEASQDRHVAGPSSPSRRRRIHDNYGLVLICTLVTLVIIAALGDLRSGGALALILLAGVFILTLRASSVGRHWSLFAAVAVVVALVAAIVAATVGATTAARAVAVAVSLVFVVASPAVIVRRLIAHHEISARTVLGALCLYLFLGLFFAFVYIACGLIQEGSFFAQTPKPSSLDYIYFSLTTLTTLGFGDMSPVSDVGRMITVLEAIIGQLYLVTVIALLVGNLGLKRGQRED